MKDDVSEHDGDECPAMVIRASVSAIKHHKPKGHGKTDPC
jgi:hypothetical protein